MTDFDPGPPGGATLQRDGDRWTLVMRRDLRHPPAVVWAALTDPEQLDRWAPFAADRDLGMPGDTTLTVIDGGQRTDTPAQVRRADAPHVLEYAWGDDLLRWELEPVPTGTRLTLRHTVAEPGVAPMAAAGWQLCLAVAARLLDGDPVGVVRGRAALDHGWQRLHDAYAQSFATR